MKAALILMLVACTGPGPTPPDDLTRQIDENMEQIRRIDELIGQIERKADLIHDLVKCVNGALDSKMNDRDQVLTIDECMRKAEYR